MTTATRNASQPYYPMDLPLKSLLGRWTHGISPSSVATALQDWLTHLAASPGKQMELLQSGLQKQMEWFLYVQKSLGGPTPPRNNSSPRDKRFGPAQWAYPPYNWNAQAFLLLQQWVSEAAMGVRGVSDHNEHISEFLLRQWLDVWSPSNFLLSNPQVLEEIRATGGMNLVQGLANWWRDAVAVAVGGTPKGIEAFEPGVSVALTPGKVVYRNRLIELIQYEPATRTVFPEPVLIVPSWIMKYYILDMSPENSLVKYLVEQGHTVFMISWNNPASADRDLGMDDYIDLGVLSALRVLSELLPGIGVHGAGYCLGGTLFAMAAAALARRAESPLKTLSMIAAQVDFQEPGELGLFIDESQVAFIEDLMMERGYLDGRQMAGAFALINSKDLVWSKLVHEYLMGAHTPLTDLRAWNADATRMPARMHGEYLRSLYLNNDLAEGRYVIHDYPVALKDIRVPMFAVATEKDHVSPWLSVYKIHLLTDTDLEFALTTGGHNVGVINPPSGPAVYDAACHRVAVRVAGGPYRDPQTWYETAELRLGSWWPTWQHWMARHSGKRVAARQISERKGLVPIMDAPGSYVHVS